jgi:uncharacterized protein YbdZ (MbtH family)
MYSFNNTSPPKCGGPPNPAQAVVATARTARNATWGCRDSLRRRYGGCDIAWQIPGGFTVVGRRSGNARRFYNRWKSARQIPGGFTVVGRRPGNARRFYNRWEAAWQIPGDFTVVGRRPGIAGRFYNRWKSARQIPGGFTIVGSPPCNAGRFYNRWEASGRFLGGFTVVGKAALQCREVLQSLGGRPADSLDVLQSLGGDPADSWMFFVRREADRRFRRPAKPSATRCCNRPNRPQRNMGLPRFAAEALQWLGYRPANSGGFYNGWEGFPQSFEGLLWL